MKPNASTRPQPEKQLWTIVLIFWSTVAPFTLITFLAVSSKWPVIAIAGMILAATSIFLAILKKREKIRYVFLGTTVVAMMFVVMAAYQAFLS